MSAYMGQIMLFAGGQTPLNWVECTGQMLLIKEYETLYSLLGTTYGGDGTMVFGVPDLRGLVPIGTGQGPGLTNNTLGATGGDPAVVVGIDTMPGHSHQAYASPGQATTNVPSSSVILATTPPGTVFYYTPSPKPPIPAPMGRETVGPNPVGGEAHANVMPFQALRYLMCVVGLDPYGLLAATDQEEDEA